MPGQSLRELTEENEHLHEIFDALIRHGYDSRYRNLQRYFLMMDKLQEYADDYLEDDSTHFKSVKQGK
jgi:hypothetical protein